MFEFNITLNDNDYLAFNKYHLLTSKEGKRQIRTARIMVPVFWLLLFAGMALLLGDFSGVMFCAMAYVPLCVGWFFFVPSTLLRGQKHSILRMHKQGKMPYTPESVLRFDETHVCQTSPDTELKYAYAQIEKIIVTDEAIFLYIGAIQAHILPLDVFGGDNAKFEAFLAFLQAKTNLMPMAD